jgi:uncharacterized membrane protein
LSKTTKKNPASKQASKQKSETPTEKNNKDACLPDDNQLPPGFPEPLKTILEKDDLPKDERNKIITAFSQTMSFCSPYPPPNVLREYQEINPALVDTMISQREREQIHRHDMDKADVDIRKRELQYKRRGQSIAAWLTPILIILVGIFVYFTMDADNQTEVLRHFLRFIIWIAALFVTGRVVSGIENIFSKRK